MFETASEIGIDASELCDLRDVVAAAELVCTAWRRRKRWRGGVWPLGGDVRDKLLELERCVEATKEWE